MANVCSHYGGRMSMIRSVVGAILMMAFASAPAGAGERGIKIGVLTDLNGYLSSLTGPGTIAAARMAVEDFGGRVLGRPIELVSADNQLNPAVASSIARRWFDSEQVDAIFALNLTAAALAVQQLARERGKIDVVTESLSEELTNRQCSPTGINWNIDTFALGTATAAAIAAEGPATWYLVRHDSAFGREILARATETLSTRGSRVVGSVIHPSNAADFSAFLLQAKVSGANYVGFANAGADAVNAIKQAHEFGLPQNGQRLVGFYYALTDIKAIGLEEAQGLRFVDAFYWDQNDATRAFSRRFAERQGKPPTTPQAAIYGAVMHYLKAVAAAQTDDGLAVMAKMRSTPINDFMTQNGRVRSDGRVIRDLYLFEAKAPNESTGPWDLYKLVRAFPGEDSFRPLAQSECPTK